uniref:Ribonuclease n=1 Tax=Macrostomum lignano TaxID=282301 RepID=A0A1I8H6I6_9PLAT
MDQYLASLEQFWSNTDQNLLIDFALPNCLLTEPCVLGIDEAGRGPVLGPMVYACAIGPLESGEPGLKTVGFADSKTLTEEQRESLFEAVNTPPLCDQFGYFVSALSPHYLTSNMLDLPKTNLNTMSMDAAVGLVQRAIDRGVRLQQIKVDTVGKPEAYRQKLLQIFPHLDVIVESKADLNHPIVSAASVCAKVTRDRLLRGWRYREKLIPAPPHDQCGSGYPAEPATKAYLRSVIDPVFGFPQLVRMSWSTAAVLMEKHCVPLRWPDDDEDETGKGSGGSSRKRRSLAPAEAAASVQMMKHFAQRGTPTEQQQRSRLRRQLLNCEFFAKHQLARGD